MWQKNTIEITLDHSTNTNGISDFSCPAGENIVTVSYDVADHFGNQAATVTTSFTCRDTKAPVLFTTPLTPIDSSFFTNPNDPGEVIHCAGDIQQEVNLGVNLTLIHCAGLEMNPDSYAFLLGQGSVALTDLASMDTQVSAGTMLTNGIAVNSDVINQLAIENTGFTCIDTCSDTTASACWVSHCGATTCDGPEFDNAVVGTYFLKYSCADEASLTTTACRTFRNLDSTRPIITCLAAGDNQVDGEVVMEADASSNFVDPGATCSDHLEGNISDSLVVTGDVIDLAEPGTYTLSYNCDDTSSEAPSAFEMVRTIIVRDTTCPYCTSPGEETVSTEASFPYSLPDVTCTDTVDGALTTAIGCTNSVGECLLSDPYVDVELTGTYSLSFSATDSQGNGANLNNYLGTLCFATEGVNYAHLTQTVVVVDTFFQPGIKLVYKNQIIHEAEITHTPSFMSEGTTSVNGWIVGAVSSAVTGVALLGYAATSKSVVSTPVPV